MNKERMLQLADYISNLPEHKFEMTYWISSKVKEVSIEGSATWLTDDYPAYHKNMEEEYEPLECGTACCIAGWAAVIESNFKPIAMMQNGKTIERRAQEWLDLTHEEASNLFFLGIDTVWIDYIEKLGFGFDEYQEQFENIKNSHAAIVIRDIVSGKTDINKTYYQDDSREILFNLGHYEDGY